MDHLRLHELYIRKNFSIKEPQMLLHAARVSYMDEYQDKPELITRSIDFLLHIMSRREFLGLIRFAMILMISKGLKVCELPESNVLLSKEAIITHLKTQLPEVAHYIVVSMYSYV